MSRFCKLFQTGRSRKSKVCRIRNVCLIVLSVVLIHSVLHLISSIRQSSSSTLRKAQSIKQDCQEDVREKLASFVGSDESKILLEERLDRCFAEEISRGKSFAYVLLALDSETAFSAVVTGFSLRETNTTVDIVLMLPSEVNITAEVSNAIKWLSMKIHRIQIIYGPYTKEKDKFYRKQMRFTKLHILNLVQYDKIAYLDSDAIVVRNIDHLFMVKGIGLVEDIGAPGNFNTGLMVVSPSPNLFEYMVSKVKVFKSYNHGDQGFINSFLQQELDNLEVTKLPIVYNMMPRLSRYASFGLYKKYIAVLHFTAEIKPWNWFRGGFADWNLEFNPELAFWWIDKSQNLKIALGRTDFRYPKICHSYRKPKWKGKFNIVINTYEDERESLVKLLEHYSRLPSLMSIFIYWHSVKKKPHTDYAKFTHGKPLYLQRFEKDDFNNRWLPNAKLLTEFTITMDDDIFIENLEDIEDAFSVARLHPDSLTGFFPRSHTSNGIKWEYEVASPFDHRKRRTYSLMLTKFEFVPTKFFYFYSCLLPFEALEHVTANKNCEDILMSVSISGISMQPPVAVQPLGKIHDIGTDVSLLTRRVSNISHHLDSRSECLEKFDKILGGLQVYTRRHSYNLFVKVPFTKSLQIP